MSLQSFVLNEVPVPEPRSVPVFRPSTLPAFVGVDPVNMLCPSCQHIVIKGVTPENWLLASHDGRPVVLRCTCGISLEIPIHRGE